MGSWPGFYLHDVARESTFVLLDFFFPSLTSPVKQVFGMAGRLLGRFVNSALSLIGTLPQSQTNGVSLWGTSDAPHLLPFLGQESSWGNRTVECSQVIRDMPESGKRYTKELWLVA